MHNEQLTMDARRAELMRMAGAEVWAILPGAIERMLAAPSPLAPLRFQGEGELYAITRPGPKSGRVARVPIVGMITKASSIWSLFGGTTVEKLTAALRQVALDETVGTVLLDIDSPGGTVSGLPALAAEVRALRESKHVVALANDLAASAAYWVASQADEIVASPEALTGSIGVFAVHDDYSAMMERIGIKTTYIHAGKYKVEGNPDEPLGDEARAHIQASVDEAYGLFVGDVARGRGVTAAQVRADYGEGRVLTARAAKAAGMIDRIATYDETVQRLSGMGTRHGDAAATGSRHGDAMSTLANKRRRLEIADKTF